MIARLTLPAQLQHFSPHTLGAGGSVFAMMAAMALVTAMTDPRTGDARALYALPAPHIEPINMARIVSDTGHDAALHLRPHHDEDSDPRLPGVGELVDVTGHNDTHHASYESGHHDEHHGDHHDSHGGSHTRGAVAAPTHGSLAAPHDGLFEPGQGGPLPIKAEDGRTSFDAYARPFSPSADRPAIAIMVGGLGLSKRATQRAIDELPPEITLSFMPYAEDLQADIDRARAAGHEVVLEIPMEPYDYDAHDTGPHTLLADASRSENTRRLEWLMSRGAGYFAITNYLGARFSASERSVDVLTANIAKRGVGMLHDGGSKASVMANAAQRHGAPFAAADRVIDGEESETAIDDELLELEALALQHGNALGAASALPVTIDQVAAWAEHLQLRGYDLAPVSAVMRARTAETHAPALDHASSDHHDDAHSTVFKTVKAGYGVHKDAHEDTEGGDDHGGGH